MSVNKFALSFDCSSHLEFPSAETFDIEQPFSNRRLISHFWSYGYKSDIIRNLLRQLSFIPIQKLYPLPYLLDSNYFDTHSTGSIYPVKSFLLYRTRKHNNRVIRSAEERGNGGSNREF